MRISIRTELLAAGGASTALVLLATFNEAGVAFFALPRLLLTMLLVLAIPGYFWQIALFPRASSLEGWARAALIVSLSAASVPFLILVLDGALQTPLRFETMLAGIVIWSGLGAGAAWFRRRRLPYAQSFALHVPAVHLRQSIRQDRLGSTLILVLAVSMLIIVVSLAATYIVPGPSQQFTEFYLLGSDGLAEAYLASLQVAVPVRFDTSVVNREDRTWRYSVVVMTGEDVIGQSISAAVAPGEQAQISVTAIPVRAGKAQPLDLLLMREGSVGPYRHLRLWVGIAAASG
ncbi:MAG TPA: DUF1616 domain-containing protein [Candidatus Limnocylindrales bacterium]|nr:DUF1616 domain-containing protein [Candidatus Limnocylindrales bacterium]